MPNDKPPYEPNYRIATIEELIDRYGDVSWANLIIERSCQTCGESLARMGDRCPKCTEKFLRDLDSFCKALTEHLTEPYVHSFTRGHLDPHSRDDRRYFDP